MHHYRRDLTKAERRIIKRIILIAGIVSLLCVLFAPGWGLIHYRMLKGRVETLTRENQDLAQRNEELSKEIDRLKNDDAYLEELARQKYGLLKENETVYEVK